MIPYCKAHGIGLIPWSPLHQGDLAKPVEENTVRKEESKGTMFEMRLSDADKTIIGRVQELANKKGWKMSDVALAWIQKKVTSPIVGINSVSSPVAERILSYEVLYLGRASQSIDPWR